MNDEWRAIPGIRGYLVNRQGEILGIRGRILKPTRFKEIPYSGFSYYGHAMKKYCLVHRAVLLAFVGPPPKNQECRHLDGNPKNNNLENLKWGTHSENMQDRKRHGTYEYGEKNPHVKLTEKTVLEIRAIGKQKTLEKIRKEYGISIGNASAIINRKTWTHI